MHKANDIASVILDRQATWTDAMTLQKLLYYVQAWHLAVTNKPLFSEKIKAWKDGPVVPQVWHDRKDQESRRASGQDVSAVALDETASKIIDLVLLAYGDKSGSELSALTHSEDPWLEAREGVPEGANSSQALSNESIARFYRAPRLLGGRSAADLAAGGVHIMSGPLTAPLDIDSLMDEIDSDCDVEDEWGGANLCRSEARTRDAAPNRALLETPA